MPSLTSATALVLDALARGYRHGFDILDATGSNYRIIFVICAIVYVGALGLFHVLAPRMAPAKVD